METATALKKHALKKNPAFGGRPVGARDKAKQRRKDEAFGLEMRMKVEQSVREILENVVKKASHELGRLALGAKFEPTRLGAIREIYDRVLGKAEPLNGSAGQTGPITVVFQWGRRPDQMDRQGAPSVETIEHED